MPLGLSFPLHLCVIATASSQIGKKCVTASLNNSTAAIKLSVDVVSHPFAAIRSKWLFIHLHHSLTFAHYVYVNGRINSRCKKCSNQQRYGDKITRSVDTRSGLPLRQLLLLKSKYRHRRLCISADFLSRSHTHAHRAIFFFFAFARQLPGHGSTRLSLEVAAATAECAYVC